jgi:hypothetical protein
MNWPKTHRLVSDFMAEMIEGEAVRVIVMEAKLDSKQPGAYHGRATSKDGKKVHIIVDRALSADQQKAIINKDLADLKEERGKFLPLPWWSLRPSSPRAANTRRSRFRA